MERITNAESLLRALDARPNDHEAAKRFDEAVWSACGADGTILVTDLSGFTRITKGYGILHFLSIFRRCQLACTPLIAAHGGVLLKQEADDFIVFFERPEAALASALDMLRAMRALNRTLREEDRVYMCMGLEHGPLLRLTDDAYGDPVNVAFKLGEDAAQPKEILVGPNAFARLSAAGFPRDDLRVEGPREIEVGQVTIAHHSIRLKEED